MENTGEKITTYGFIKALIRSAFKIGQHSVSSINGNTSDGYHTFNELYHHRAILFSIICNNYSSISWKSKYHHDGSMYEGMFIVGMTTPDGHQLSYHYNIDPYWDLFKVPEITIAPVFDGHTPSDVLCRLMALPLLKDL